LGDRIEQQGRHEQAGGEGRRRDDGTIDPGAAGRAAAFAAIAPGRRRRGRLGHRLLGRDEPQRAARQARRRREGAAVPRQGLERDFKTFEIAAERRPRLLIGQSLLNVPRLRGFEGSQKVAD
jgi:hypothetical protein